MGICESKVSKVPSKGMTRATWEGVEVRALRKEDWYVLECSVRAQLRCPPYTMHCSKLEIARVHPVWVLIQGQTVARKILPKSKCRAYVGYNDASKSVLCYNAETRKILTSRNYVFLTAKEAEPIEEIQVEDTPTREGERGGQTRVKWKAQRASRGGRTAEDKGSPTQLSSPQ
jgi:hypothetical protein